MHGPDNMLKKFNPELFAEIKPINTFKAVKTF